MCICNKFMQMKFTMKYTKNKNYSIELAFFNEYDVSRETFSKSREKHLFSLKKE